MFSKSTWEQCVLLKRGAAGILNKIRGLRFLEEDDEVSYDMVYELFENYNVGMIADDGFVRDMMSNLHDGAAMETICDKAKEAEMGSENVEQDTDLMDLDELDDDNKNHSGNNNEATTVENNSGIRSMFED